MKIKTQELIGPALDWAVAKCCGMAAETLADFENGDWLYGHRKYSSNWAQGGPIIDRELNNLFKHNQLDKALPPVWCAVKHVPSEHGTALLNVDGPTPLIAAMRCFCAAKLGNEVDIPEELK